VLLDQNLYPEAETRYAGKVPPHCELLLGPRYALLRDEFRGARETAAPRRGAARRLLVSFGGVDAANMTEVTLEALAACATPFAEVDVVIGAAHPRRSAIEATCARQRLRCHVQSDRMAELTAAADVAVGAAGVSTWERCCLGVPTLTLAVAPNQEVMVRAAALRGLIVAPFADGTAPTSSTMALHLEALAGNAPLRQLMSRQGMAVVDGRGASRVAARLDTRTVCVRRATLDDARPLFEWRNHPAVRQMSHDAAPIGWTDHLSWLETVVASVDRVLLIGEHERTPVGVVRFDVSGPQATVSIYRVPGSAPGLGGPLLEAAERWLQRQRLDVTSLAADVLADNEPSHRLFQAAGYCVESSRYRKRFES
jgi:RimJ/RimL family protein N-acetyltransferase